MSRKVVAMVVALSAVVWLSACGDDSGSASDSGSATDDGTTSAPAVSAPMTAPPTSTTSTSTTTTTPPGVTVFSFEAPDSVSGWSNVNDTVMGGISTSSAEWESGALVFAGAVSLANNGGFTSLVSPVSVGVGAAMAGAGEIVVAGQGDGRSYVLQLRSDVTGRRWTQTFTPPTTSGEVVLALSAFESSDFRLDPIAPVPLDVSSLDGMTFYSVDGQEGPFRLELTRIAAR
jgi:NADH dehydrogenase [ubiquinone] 1 alpha subcomplex assembly factor 1